MELAVERRSCFAEEDNGLASLDGTEARPSEHANHVVPTFSRSICSARRGFRFRNVRLSRSMRAPAARVYDARFEDHHSHFLDSCFLCNKPLRNNRDIFMYRGDTPFCSEECRQEQIDIDEAKGKNWNFSTIKALRNKEYRNSNSPSKAQYTYHAGSVAAA